MDWPRALLVDLDDTILDDTGPSDELWQQVCRETAERFDGVDAAILFRAIDSHRHWFWSDAERHRIGRADLRAATSLIVAKALHEFPSVPATEASTIAHRYRDLRDQHQSLLPGAVETLKELRRRRIRLAMLTNGAAEPQRFKIERFGLATFFDAIFIEGELGFGKPDARVYRTALNTLETTPDLTWCIGDNLEWDVAGAQREGIRGIWLDGRQRGLPPGSPIVPDRIVHRLSDLIDMPE